MATRRRPQDGDQNAAPELEPGEIRESFLAFVESIPADGQISVSLRRFPHAYTPQVSAEETLAPVGFQEDLEAMQAEIRSRYGPGKYKLYLRFTDPSTRARKMVSPSFILAPSAEDYTAGRELERAPEDNPVQVALHRLTQAAEVKAQAAEVAALESVVSGTGGKGGALSDFAQLATVFKALQPPAPPSMLDQLTAMRAAGFPVFSQGAGGGGPAEMIALVREVVSLKETLGGGAGGPGGFWDFAGEVVRMIGPNIGEILANLNSVLGQLKTAPPAAPVPMPSANPPADMLAPAPEPPAVEAATGPDAAACLEAMKGDTDNARLLGAVLSAAYVESGLPAPYWVDGFARIETMLDDLLPGAAAQFVLASATLPAVWFRLDPRTNPAWVRMFADYLSSPEGPDDPAPATGEPT